jgi:hypothetical protein
MVLVLFPAVVWENKQARPNEAATLLRLAYGEKHAISQSQKCCQRGLVSPEGGGRHAFGGTPVWGRKVVLQAALLYGKVGERRNRLRSLGVGYVVGVPNNKIQPELLILAVGEVGRVSGACWKARWVMFYPQSG